MEDSVIKTQHLSSIEGVISINKTHNLTIFAMLMYAFINVLKCFLIHWVDNEVDFLFWDSFFINVFLDKLPSLFGWMIINVYNAIIAVILHEEWI